MNLFNSLRNRRGATPLTTLELAVISQRRPISSGTLATYGKFLGGEQSGYVPPAAIHAALFRQIIRTLSQPDLPIRTVGAIHEATQWQLIAPIESDEPLDFRTGVVGFSVADGKARVAVGSVVSYAGKPVYQEISTYVDRKSSHPLVDLSRNLDGLNRAALPEIPEHRSTFGVNEHGHLAAPGAVISGRTFATSAGREWAKISGDPNPIHLGVLPAKAFGFSRPLLHGAALNAWVHHSYRIDGTAPASGAIYFRAPVLLPAELQTFSLHDDGNPAHVSLAVKEPSGRDLAHAVLSVAGGVPKVMPTHPASIDTELVFPVKNGKPSTTTISRGMFRAAGGAEAAAAVDAVANWRKGYRSAIVAVSAVDAPRRGPQAAQRGLDFLGDAILTAGGRRLRNLQPVEQHVEIPAPASACSKPLEIPYNGEVLSGPGLRDAIHSWTTRKLMTTGAAERLLAFGERPLDLSDLRIGLIGAGAELSPARFFLAHGATVFAVARPGSTRIAELAAAAETLPGNLVLSPPEASDVVKHAEKIAGWLTAAQIHGLVETLYAPGGKFLIAGIGADAILRMVSEKLDVIPGWLGSPTDAYVLEPEARAAMMPERRNPLRGVARRLSKVLNLLPGDTSFGAEVMHGDVLNGLVNLQGPNYAAAKRVGRWRATVRQAAGLPVSYNIAPLSQTESVLGTPALQAAYRGMEKMGISTFPADTSAALMGALYISDLRDYQRGVLPDTDFLTRAAIPTGLWSTDTEPQAMLTKAALLGRGVHFR